MMVVEDEKDMMVGGEYVVDMGGKGGGEKG